MDRHNFSKGGEIPHQLGKALYENENSLNQFINYSSKEKNDFIRGAKGISHKSEIKNYVDTMGESHRTSPEFEHNFYE
ncbi:MAG: hypothetical protein E7509_00920 [Ruminococcus sp.]|nr:hypothetical protein [Ruminococcus sp.]